MKNYRKIIETRRKKLGMSQQEVAEMAGMRQQQYQRIESGGGNPNLTTLISICDALGLELSVIESGD